MRKLFFRLLPVYLIIFVLTAALKIMYPPTPMSVIIKAYFIFTLGLMGCYFVFRDRFVVFFETIIFCFFSIIPISSGLMIYGVTSETISHLFAILVPIFGMSFGYKLADNFEKDNNHILFSNIMKWSFWVNIILVILFQFFVGIGVAKSSQLAPGGLIIASLYYLTKKDLKKPLLGLLFIIISGKRSSLVITLFGMLVYLNDLRRSQVLDKKLIKLLAKMFASISIFMGGISYYLWNYTRFLNRFKLVFEFDFSDAHAMYVATGGRSEEIFNIIEFLNENPFRYIFGSGFGVKVEIMENFYRHYSHFSPLAYTLIFGLIFAVLIYSRLINQIIKKSDMDNLVYPFKIMFSALFMQTFFGAIIMNDIVLWTFFGMTLWLNRQSGYKTLGDN